MLKRALLKKDDALFQQAMQENGIFKTTEGAEMSMMQVEPSYVVQNED